MWHALSVTAHDLMLEDIERIACTFPRVMDAMRDAVLVPVPLHPRKERERGYNQSLLLAHAFARAAGKTTRNITGPG